MVEGTIKACPECGCKFDVSSINVCPECGYHYWTGKHRRK